eukprot:TRINITY_DN1006_c0_g1_i3.p1 TRINITY_DN1006_c0_g1~~TRINITY_DN1006_c0_g1_i3.p1  ORF type:complete len:314 (-),score=59.21 TRINITY_DN1006_c0_g1_i3:29-970(-)
MEIGHNSIMLRLHLHLLMILQILSQKKLPKQVLNRNNGNCSKGESSISQRNSEDYIRFLKTEIAKYEEENLRVKMENETLRNQKEKKPAPLYRSFSKEIRDADKELDTIVSQINNASRNRGNSDKLEMLLSIFRQHLKRRQQILSEQTQQFAQPKLQERLSRLHGYLGSAHVDFNFSIPLSDQQINEIRNLQESQMRSLHSLLEGREVIQSEIKSYYKEKIMGEQLVISNSDYIDSQQVDNDVIIYLSTKIDALKKNIKKESSIFFETLRKLSQILLARQESELLLGHYKIEHHFSLLNLLNSVWDMVDKEEE